MDSIPGNLADVATASKRIAQGLLAIGENRLELFAVEVQEQREYFIRAIVMALVMAAFGLLAGIALTFAIVLLMWERSPIITLFVLTGIYGAVAAFIWHRLNQMQRQWQTLPATLAQLRKDRECLDRCLG
jgi:uncharacterized membrane protein YqjE